MNRAPLRLFALLLPALLMLGLLVARPAAAAEPLPAEQAFHLDARALDDRTVEIRFQVAEGYYLYKHKFKFEADGITFGEAQLPPGKRKKDDIYGEVETYRGELVFPLPLSAGQPPFKLTVTSQGCADLGICYPPTPQTVSIDPAGQRKVGGFLARALGQAPAAEAPLTAPASTTAVPADAHDESGRIARLLAGGGTLATLASFFGFGLLLAFTPCVFPMIPILSGIIVGAGHKTSHARAFLLSLAYVLGMAITYAAAGIAAGMTGTLLSAALQSAWVLGGFAAVFVVLSFSMFGFYELQLPTFLQSKMSEEAGHLKGGSIPGVAAMGALSALIVGPCVAAPLAGALLYIGQTGDAVLGGAALFAMGLGMGLPLLAVGVSTGSLLPRSGPWMEAIKKAFGVVLLATAVWIVSPVIPVVAQMLAWSLLLIVPAIYLHALDPLPPHARGWQRFWKGIGIVLLLLGAAMLLGTLAGSRDPLQPLSVLRGGTASADTRPLAFTRVRSLAELDSRIAAAGQPVLLDFYADWCVSCKEMERFTFADPRVQARLAGWTLLQVDVTANSDDDRALLQRFKLYGPPGIIFFDRSGKEIEGLRVIGFQNAEEFLALLSRVY